MDQNYLRRINKKLPDSTAVLSRTILPPSMEGLKMAIVAVFARYLLNTESQTYYNKTATTKIAGCYFSALAPKGLRAGARNMAVLQLAHGWRKIA